MLTIHADTKVNILSRENPPAAFARSGDTVRFETLDCFGCQIQREDQPMDQIDWSNVNPATGPLYVEDALPGDVLKVEILNIEIGDRGVMIDGPKKGVTGRALTNNTTRILPIADGIIHFSEKLSIPVDPMIGVIGTAPAGAGIDTGTPDAHGGNMDCNQIKIGSTLYLPVHVAGALLAMGDLHARMGDGEVEVCGVEVAGAVTVRITVLKYCGLPTPFLTNSQMAAAIFSAKTLDDAGIGATMAMHRFLTTELGMDAHEAGMLLSIVGNLRICQVVDPQKTCRMEIPLHIADAYGYTFA